MSETIQIQKILTLEDGKQVVNPYYVITAVAFNAGYKLISISEMPVYSALKQQVLNSATGQYEYLPAGEIDEVQLSLFLIRRKDYVPPPGVEIRRNVASVIENLLSCNGAHQVGLSSPIDPIFSEERTERTLNELGLVFSIGGHFEWERLIKGVTPKNVDELYPLKLPKEVLDY